MTRPLKVSSISAFPTQEASQGAQCDAEDGAGWLREAGTLQTLPPGPRQVRRHSPEFLESPSKNQHTDQDFTWHTWRSRCGSCRVTLLAA